MTDQPMSEERLEEIEGQHDGCEGYLDTMELIAEVRRLQELEEKPVSKEALIISLLYELEPEELNTIKVMCEVIKNQP